MSELPPIRPAATVVVLRPVDAGPGVEVLMVRRNRSIAFMGGAYVFPGGRLDDGDAVRSPRARAGVDGLAGVARCRDLTSDDEAAYRVAAIRELLEEAGLLLARRGDAFVDGAEAARLRALPVGAAGFASFVAAHGLRLALDAVMPFAHWVTPPVEIRRFDTRFLLARLPAGQDASHDDGEMTALEWMRPDDAIDRALAGELLLPPPTWTTLRRLARFASVDEAWAWAATTPIVRIEPGFSRDAEATTLMLPGDPTYPLPPGLEPIAETRFALVDGAWRPVRGPDPIPGGA